MQFDDRAAFVAYMTEGQPQRPANILGIVAINQGHAPLTMEEPSVPGVSPGELDRLMAEGCAVVDTRSSATFGSAHVPGAYNLHVTSPEFEQRVGWIVPAEVPIALITEDPESVRRALHKLAFIGLDHRVHAALCGGMSAWIGAGLPHATLSQISVHELQAELLNGGGMRALDVREPDEWDAGHIDGAASMSFKVLVDHLGEIGVEPEDRVSVVCAGGVRSSTACSILLRNGFRNVFNVTGGMGAWNAADLPTVG